MGIVIGRLGCQLSDVRDLTYGTPTSLPWGWNYGDGVPRHPTAFYEIGALGVLGLIILRSERLRTVPGDRFRALMIGYLALRFVLDFLKPPYGLAVAGVPVPNNLAGLTAIQWASLAGIAYYSCDVVRWVRRNSHDRAPLTEGQRKVVSEP